ncbi:tetratricopeptide repeat protein [Marinomonas ostreistagni]|uniref:tetratricopeptide repeat protein n=1 Tax=Marinomonas ostreistagni TaxID=359209 RepID=UPI0019507006|nr:tetratricopeptide repeat protein [Marinomonas ostreistagni]MBM6549608.1 tetratricopeptide repeat protein [Marinomonas ostreistagni]
MIYWQHLTRQANEAHTRASFADAQELNQKALACAKATFEDDFKIDAESAVSAVIVSYLNLAEVAISMKEWRHANDYFERGVHFLQTVLVSSDILHEHRDLIERMATHIRFEWELFSTTYGHRLEQARRQHALLWRSKGLLDNPQNASSWAV